MNVSELRNYARLYGIIIDEGDACALMWLGNYGFCLRGWRLATAESWASADGMLLAWQDAGLPLPPSSQQLLGE